MGVLLPIGANLRIVGWVEEKRVLSLRAFPKPIIRARGRMMGFAATREGRVVALPILRIRMSTHLPRCWRVRRALDCGTICCDEPEGVTMKKVSRLLPFCAMLLFASDFGP